MPGTNFVKKYMRVDEVADLFDVHPRTVERWAESTTNCLQIIKLSPRKKRISGENLQLFITTRTSQEEY